jgi:hypothetical protein
VEAEIALDSNVIVYNALFLASLERGVWSFYPN